MKKTIITLVLLLVMIQLALAAPDDADDDTVRDEFDICPQTPQGEVLVDPQANLDYAGCTCEQVKAMVDDECIILCHEELLEIREGAAGERVECPENYCDGTTLMDFQTGGYGECEQGVFEPRNCGPNRIEQALECVGEIEPTEEFLVIPRLEGDVKNIAIEGAEVSYVFDNVLGYRTQGNVSLVIVFDKESNITVFNTSLKSGISEVVARNIHYGEDRQDTLFYFVDWPQLAGSPGTHKMTLEFSFIQDGEHRTISQVISYETVRAPLDVSTGVLGYDLMNKEATALTEEEETYAQAIFDLAASKGATTAGVDGIGRVLDKTTISKQIEQTASSTVFDIIVEFEGIDKIKGLTIIEEIPKEAAEDLTHVTFSKQPDVILEEDPLIMWHFDEAEERVELSYEVDRPVEVTGNTVLTASEIVEASTPWHVIVPMIIIPLIAIIILVLPRARSKP